jgi:hypothetical protein
MPAAAPAAAQGAAAPAADEPPTVRFDASNILINPFNIFTGEAKGEDRLQCQT